MAKKVAKSSLPKAVVQEKRQTRSNKNQTSDVPMTVKQLKTVLSKNKPLKSAEPDHQQPTKIKTRSNNKEQVSGVPASKPLITVIRSKNKLPKSAKPDNQQPITAEKINNKTSTDPTNMLFFQCNVCQLAFETIQQLVKHVKTHFSGHNLLDHELFEDTDLIHNKKIGDKPYKCEDCQHCFARSEDLNIHLRVHRNLPVFECHRCQRMFAQSINLANHVKKVHLEVVDPERLLEIKAGNELLMKPSDTADQLAPEAIDNYVSSPYEAVRLNDKIYFRKYKCPVYKCLLVFVKMTTLAIHCRRNHLVTDYTDSDLMDIENNIKILDEQIEQNRIQLNVLAMANPEKFLDNQSPAENLLVERSADPVVDAYKCANCASTFQRPSSLVEHMQSHSNARRKCQYCSLTFLQSHSLAKHVKKHLGDNVKQCEVCQVPYAEEKDLVKHFRIHLSGKPHKCTICSKQFAQSCDKVKHMRIHTGEKPFECKICHKKFAHLTSIKKHNLVHSGLRPFVCDFCGKAFQHSCNLVVHNRTHTGERPFKCSVLGCEKTFNASGHYNDHMKIHRGVKNYKCELCGKEFLHQTSYRKHERMHSGTNRIKCNVCDKSFSQQGHYKEHLRIHTGEKPFVCTICEKMFRRPYALTSHMKSHANSQAKNKGLVNPEAITSNLPTSSALTCKLDQAKQKVLITDQQGFYPLQLQIDDPTILLQQPLHTDQSLLQQPQPLIFVDSTNSDFMYSSFNAYNNE